MTEKRLSGLTLMSIHNAMKIDTSMLVQAFIKNNTRRMFKPLETID